ncbi:rRNA methyltransferase [Bienertia sinuspersici]
MINGFLILMSLLVFLKRNILNLLFLLTLNLHPWAPRSFQLS